MCFASGNERPENREAKEYGSTFDDVGFNAGSSLVQQ